MVTLNQINSITSLQERLATNPSASSYFNVMNNLRITEKDLEQYTYWEEGRYTRNCIMRNDHFELVLMCWNTGVITDIHDHDGQEGWIYMVAGEITEERFPTTGNGNFSEDMVVTTRLTPGMVGHINDNMGLHRLMNTNEKGRSISLHLYAKPLVSARLFNDNLEVKDEKQMRYDTYNGVPVEH